MYEIIQNKARQNFRALQSVVSDVRGRVLNRQQPSRHPVVIMYHSVSDRGTQDWGPWKYAITPQAFDQQLSESEKYHTVISIEELVNWLVNDELIPHDSVVLTFDDAYSDFKNEALPVLKKYNFPATVYVSTRLLNRNKAPFEHRLANILFKRDELSTTVGDLCINTSLKTKDKTITAYKNIRSELKLNSIEQREYFLEDIKIGSEADDIIINPDKLQEIQEDPLVTVGAHGHEHVLLTTLSRKEQNMNLKACHDRLTELLEKPPRHFSYPYGSFDESAIQAVKKAGFESAVTTQSRRVSPRDWGQPYTIPRIDAAADPTPHL